MNLLILSFTALLIILAIYKTIGISRNYHMIASFTISCSIVGMFGGLCELSETQFEQPLYSQYNLEQTEFALCLKNAKNGNDVLNCH